MSAGARPSGWPLSLQVILALALALLPLGIIALLAAADTYRELERGQSELAASRLATAANAVEAGLDEDFATLQAALFDNAADPASRQACDRLLTSIERTSRHIASLARLDENGRLLCASAGSALPSSGAMAAAANVAPRGMQRYVREILVEPDGTPDLLLVIRDVGSRSAGAAVARLPRPSLMSLLDKSGLQGAEQYRLWLRDTAVVTWGDTPEVLPTALNNGAGIRRTAEIEGRRWFTGTMALNPRGVTLGIARPAREITEAQALSIALPMAMWLVAVVIGWLAIRRLVVVPLQTMRRTVERYAAGDGEARVGVGQMRSQEANELAGAFDRMADQIGRHDAEMQGSLATQKKLTKEVHHRVKNNLQIVASLLSLQSREAKSREVADAYATIQKRVNALALVHRWLFDDDTLQGVDLRALSQDLCSGLEHGIAGSDGLQVSMACDAERLRVTQDTAVPIAFLVTELATAAARLSKGAPLSLRVTARAEDGGGRLTVEASPFMGADAFASGTSDPSGRIVQGMARQMRSPLDHDPVRGSYSIRFPVTGGAAPTLPHPAHADA